MSWGRDGDTVTLTMTYDEYIVILEAFAALTAEALRHNRPGMLNKTLKTLNSLNHGNPMYTPYEVKP